MAGTDVPSAPSPSSSPVLVGTAGPAHGNSSTAQVPLAATGTPSSSHAASENAVRTTASAAPEVVTGPPDAQASEADASVHRTPEAPRPAVSEEVVVGLVVAPAPSRCPHVLPVADADEASGTEALGSGQAVQGSGLALSVPREGTYGMAG